MDFRQILGTLAGFFFVRSNGFADLLTLDRDLPTTAGDVAALGKASAACPVPLDGLIAHGRVRQLQRRMRGSLMPTAFLPGIVPSAGAAALLPDVGLEREPGRVLP